MTLKMIYFIYGFGFWHHKVNTGIYNLYFNIDPLNPYYYFFIICHIVAKCSDITLNVFEIN